MSSNKRLSDVGEWGVLERLKKFYPLDDARLVVGFGDDAAVIDLSPEHNEYLLVTVDTLVEGTHFLPAHYDPYLLGKKALAVNLSDISAFGGIPEFFLVSLAVPGSFSLKDVNRIYKGICDEAKKYNLLLANGDLVRSKRLVISITVLGKKPKNEHLPLRSSVQVGQFVYVTGTLGDSGAGLHILQKKQLYKPRTPEWRLVQRHIAPTARVNEGRLLGSHLSDLAMIDISDGLYNELSLLSKFSGVGFDIKLANIPLSTELSEYCRARKINPYHFALYGGEDYELLFTTFASPEQVSHLFTENCLVTQLSCIGKVTAKKQIVFRDTAGRNLKVTDRTFRHF
ncbi:thiamine-phosphate kinase [Candidatus Sumerlaeota bacterium]|nr:thiamine-phosphate kinase [Candidatus Sumerlaeota bacterium]